jgi:RHS repeat-associated protein
VTTNYSWDGASHLVAVTSPGFTSNTFSYNGLDTRISKIEAQGTTVSRHDGSTPSSPVIGDSGASYTPGISEFRGTSSRFLHSVLKNSTSRTLSDQSSEATREYDAFGNVPSSSGVWQGPFGYGGGLGYQEDSDFGLLLLGARYYDPSTGRFLSPDPALAGMNLYDYCGGNPLSRCDPSGEQWRDKAGDTSTFGWWGWFWHANAENNMTRKTAMVAFADADLSASIFGHGARGIVYLGTNDEQLNADDMRKVAAARKRMHKAKLQCVEFDCCETCASPEFVNACLDFADEVRGYEGWTVSKRGEIGNIRVFRKKLPLDHDPDVESEYMYSKDSKDKRHSYRPSGVTPIFGGYRPVRYP